MRIPRKTPTRDGSGECPGDLRWGGTSWLPAASGGWPGFLHSGSSSFKVTRMCSDWRGDVEEMLLRLRGAVGNDNIDTLRVLDVL